MALVVYQPSDQNEYPNNIAISSDNKKYAGLRNQGATCYLNSVLQTLYMTPEFRSAIFKWRYDESKDGPIVNCIPYQLQKLFGYLQLNVDTPGDTVGLTTSFGWTGSDVFQQQDAQELFRVLFDALEYTFKGTQMENFIDDIFAGEMIDYIRCIDVDHEKERNDKFLDFSLAIIPFTKSIALKSLEECIEMYLQPEILDNENQYYAEPVGKKVDAIKGIKISKLPFILSIQLKRFVFDFTGNSVVQKKINDVISFPMVLDMNKYVSNKKKITSDNSNPNDTSIESETITSESSPNNEIIDDFEEFLQEQILLLRNNRNKKSSNCSTNVIDTLDDDVSIGTDNEIDKDIPDLVDYFGNKSPDQIIEEKRKKENEFYLTNGGNIENLQELVKERGEWIYELYAVLIHSGAIAGGHYYAYIKDIDSKQWFNFNDSYVTEINESNVVDAWGKAIYSTSNDWTNRYNNNITINNNQKTLTSYSGANAYMLMYRKVTLSNDSSSFIFPSNDLIPDYIKNLVQQEIELNNLKIYEEEERKKQLIISIDIKKVIVHNQVKTTNTLFELLNNIWNKHDLYKEQEFIDLQDPEFSNIDTDCDADNTTDSKIDLEAVNISSSNNKRKYKYIPIQLDRIRLRQYNQSNNHKTLIYDSLVLKDKTLQELNLSTYQTYLIELRSIDEEWLPYYNNGINLFISVYNSNTNSFYDPVQFSLPTASSVLDLKLLIHQVLTKGTRKYLSYGPSSMRILKLNRNYQQGINSIKPIDVLSMDDSLGLWDSFRLLFHDKIYVEEIIEISDDRKSSIINSMDDYDSLSNDDKELIVNSPCYLLLYQSLFTINLFYNIPLVYHINHNNNSCQHKLKADARWTVNKLREVLANEINKDLEKNDLTKPLVDHTRLRIHLHYIETVDIRTNFRLSQENINDGCKIFLTIGFIAPPNHYQLKLKLFTPLFDGKLRDQSIHLLNYKDENLTTISPSSITNTSNHKENRNPMKLLSTSHPADGYEGSGSSDEENEWDDSNDYYNQSTNIQKYNEMTPINKSYQTVEAIPLLDVEEPENSNVDENKELPDLSSDVTLLPNNNDNQLITAIATTEIEPSNFGALMVTSEADNSEIIKLTEIDNIYLSDESFVRDAAVLICEELRKLLPAIPHIYQLFQSIGLDLHFLKPHHIRIRESTENFPGKILQTNLTFRQQNIYFNNNKYLMIQILANDKELSSQQIVNSLSNQDAVINLQKWERTTWSLSPLVEVVISGNMTLQELSFQLSKYFGISNQLDMLVLVTKSYGKVPISQLNSDMIKSIYKSWTSILSMPEHTGYYNNNYYNSLSAYQYSLKKLSDMSINPDFRFRHGDLLLIQNKSEPLKELTSSDILSLQLVEDTGPITNNLYPTYSTRFDIYGTNVNNNFYNNTSYNSKNNNSQGIKIITQKDRDVIKQSVDKSFSEEQREPELILPQYEENVNNEENEFERQGGIALFSDIADL